MRIKVKEDTEDTKDTEAAGGCVGRWGSRGLFDILCQAKTASYGNLAAPSNSHRELSLTGVSESLA